MYFKTDNKEKAYFQLFQASLDCFVSAICNYPETVPDCNGHSNAFDGVAYLPELSGSRDTCLVEADGSEGIFLAEFDMDMIRRYREKEVHGNAYRRPDRYKLLLENNKESPFIRKDYKKR